MILIMFDVDGTLTQSCEVDTKCYCCAITQTWGIEDIDSDWSVYSNTTDAGIASEIYERHYGKKPTVDELTRMRACLMAAFRNEFADSGRNCSAILGAKAILQIINQKPDYAWAIATGCWKEPAELKLDSAKINYQNIPFASADDDHTREEIMLAAQNRAQKYYEVSNFKSVIYIGDGVWDVKACRNLGFDFIGVASGANAERLKNAGARFMVPDFSNEKLFMELVETLNKAKEKN